jgi:type I restriction enzyme R subunit
MRQALSNENADLVKENRKYVMRITGKGDGYNDEGKVELDNFIDPENLYPTLVTTSKLLSTGVDAQTCKLIVLDSNINSMTEFKQIIGRGTRINEDYGKTHFTIMDFRKVTELFADPDFDGDPVQVKEIKQGEDIPDDVLEGDDDIPEEEEFGTEDKPVILEGGGEIDKIPEPRGKIYVDGVPVEVAYKRTQYLDGDGKLITESLKDYSKKRILDEYASLDEFINQWDKHKQKYYIIEELEKQGVYLSELQSEISQDIDPFDLILHVAFDHKKLMTRKERAEKVRKKNYFDKYSEKARKVLDTLLDKYADEGLQHIEEMKILTIRPLSDFGSPMEIVEEFGGRDEYVRAVEELEREIYSF